jgi:hypothetical protein
MQIELHVCTAFHHRARSHTESSRTQHSPMREAQLEPNRVRREIRKGDGHAPAAHDDPGADIEHAPPSSPWQRSENI